MESTTPLEIEGEWEQIVTLENGLRGKRVRVTVLSPATPVAVPETRSLSQIAAEIFADVPDEEWDKLPADLSDNIDHYVYGLPKR